jgi:hypothetical protein
MEGGHLRPDSPTRPQSHQSHKPLQTIQERRKRSHEELGIPVPLGMGGDLGGDIFYLFLQVFKEGKISVDVGDGEGMEPVCSLLGEDVFVGWLNPVFMEFGMDFVF